METIAKIKSSNKIVAKVANAREEYKVGDTKITALKASNVELKASEI